MSGGAVLQPSKVRKARLFRGAERRVVLFGDGGIAPFPDFSVAIGEGDSTGVVMIGSRDIHPFVDRAVEWIANEEPVIDRAGAFIDEHPEINRRRPDDLSQFL